MIKQGRGVYSSFQSHFSALLIFSLFISCENDVVLVDRKGRGRERFVGVYIHLPVVLLLLLLQVTPGAFLRFFFLPSFIFFFLLSQQFLDAIFLPSCLKNGAGGVGRFSRLLVCLSQVRCF